MKKHTLVFLSSALLFVGLGLFFTDVVNVNAQETSADAYFNEAVLKGTGLPTDSTTTTILRLIRSVLQAIGIIDLVLIIYAGFLIVLSGASPEKNKQGKNILFWAIVGTIIILSSLGIVEFIDTFI